MALEREDGFGGLTGLPVELGTEPTEGMAARHFSGGQKSVSGPTVPPDHQCDLQGLCGALRVETGANVAL